MNDLAETKKFFEDLMSGNYEVFDFSNPMRNVPTRTSYHIKKQKKIKFLKSFSKSVLFWHLNLLMLL